MRQLFYIYYIILLLFISCNNKKSSKLKANDEDVNGFKEVEIIKKKFPKWFIDSVELYFKNDFHGVVLLKNNLYFYEKAFGYADLNKTEKMKTEHIFQLASVSKTVTGVATLMLEQEGKLNLDSFVNHYLKDFPYYGIKVKHLLTHRSGLPNYMYSIDTFWKDSKRAMNNDDFYNYMKISKPEVYNLPDVTFSYCNTNYAYLVCLIEKITGMSFRQYVKEKIFKPCGMSSTYFYGDTSSQFKNNLVTGRMEKVEYDNNYIQNGILGDKSMYSCTYDMMLFHYALSQKKLLNEKNFKLINQPSYDYNVYGGSYSYGFRLMKVDNDLYTYHNGWYKGFYTTFWNKFDSNLCFVVLTNNKKSSHIDKIKFMKWMQKIK